MLCICNGTPGLLSVNHSARCRQWKQGVHPGSRVGAAESEHSLPSEPQWRVLDLLLINISEPMSNLSELCASSVSDGPSKQDWEDNSQTNRRSCRMPPPLDCCWMYVRVWLWLYICGLRTCADLTTPFYFAVSGRLAGRVRGKRDLPLRLHCSFCRPPLAADQVDAWLEGHAAAAGLVRRWTCWLSQGCHRPGCYVADSLSV